MTRRARGPATHAAIAAVAWLAAAAVSLLLAWRFEVGPILVRLGRRHGIHLGDVAVVLVTASWASLVTARPWLGRLRARQ